jgi:hypothetical protein
MRIDAGMENESTDPWEGWMQFVVMEFFGTNLPWIALYLPIKINLALII